jgi:hypothetical protein
MNAKEIETIKKAITYFSKPVAIDFPRESGLILLHEVIGDTAGAEEIRQEIKNRLKEIQEKDKARQANAEKRTNIYDRWATQPGWFKEFFSGIAERLRYTVFAERKNWAIVKKEGGSVYLNRASGTKYFPTEYCLIKKSDRNCAGNGHQETLLKGRLKKGDEEKLMKALEDAEAKGT